MKERDRKKTHTLYQVLFHLIATLAARPSRMYTPANLHYIHECMHARACTHTHTHTTDTHTHTHTHKHTHTHTHAHTHTHRHAHTHTTHTHIHNTHT